MTEYTPPTWGTGSQFTADQASAMAAELDEQEGHDQAQDALIAPSARLTKSIASTATVTLTAAECLATSVTLTGATQDVEVIVPTGRSFRLANRTDYTLSVHRAGANSARPVVIQSGGSMEVQS